MDSLEQRIFALFERLENDLKETVVMDGESIEYFDDAATDYFVNTKFEIVDLISESLPKIIGAKSDLNVLPAIALCADIYDLAKILSQNTERFPLAFEYAESRTLDDFNWQPIYDALRDYFDEDVIALISSKYEFDLARTAFMEILEIAENFYSYGEFEDFRAGARAADGFGGDILVDVLGGIDLEFGEHGGVGLGRDGSSGGGRRGGRGLGE